MSILVRLEETKCPSCGAMLTLPEGNTRVVKCEYCGSEFVINVDQERENSPRIPNWQPLPEQATPSVPDTKIRCIIVIIAAVVLVGIIGLIDYRKTQVKEKDAAKNTVQYTVPDITVNTNAGESQTEEGEISGMLGQMVCIVFDKDAESITEQDLAKMQWISDKSDLDYSYLGISFENPLENPEAELKWLTFPRDTESGYKDLYRFKGLKKLDTRNRLSSCNLKGLQLESVSAYFETFKKEAEAFDNCSTIRELYVRNEIEQLEGLELFSNVEQLSINANNLSDVDALVSLKQLKSLILTNADNIYDFSVLASGGALESLSIESEYLKSLDFLKRMPQLKSLELKDGEFLDLNGIEALQNLEHLSIVNCDELTDMSSVNKLLELRELTLDKPYKCPEPSLAQLSKLQNLTLEGFDSCTFLPKLTNLEELVLHSCTFAADLDLSGLSHLRKLECTSYTDDKSLNYVSRLTALEELDLGGIVTYEDISGIFSLPNLKKLNISGMECEIDFDKIVDNPSLESLELAGIKLYENVKISGGYGIVNVDWDDVYLVDHINFLTHFPNLKRLDIADNKLEELDFAAELVKLEEINFSDNYVTDMHVLSTLPCLQQVNCKGNPISNLRVLDEARVNIISK